MNDHKRKNKSFCVICKRDFWEISKIIIRNILNKKPDIIVEAQRHNIDYNTIDKLCGYNNKDINAFFNKLIDYINYQEKDNEALETFSVEDNY